MTSYRDDPTWQRARQVLCDESLGDNHDASMIARFNAIQLLYLIEHSYENGGDMPTPDLVEELIGPERRRSTA